MPLIPAQRRPSAWKRATRFVAILVLLLVAVGFIFDLVSGLPLLRSSRSWTAWSVGIVALGVLFSPVCGPLGGVDELTDRGGRLRGRRHGGGNQSILRIPV